MATKFHAAMKWKKYSATRGEKVGEKLGKVPNNPQNISAKFQTEY